MSTLQIRDVPEPLRAELKRRAASAGQSLSDYLRGELEQLAAQPTVTELTERIRLRGRVEPDSDIDAVLHAERSDR